MPAYTRRRRREDELRQQQQQNNDQQQQQEQPPQAQQPQQPQPQDLPPPAQPPLPGLQGQPEQPGQQEQQVQQEQLGQQEPQGQQGQQPAGPQEPQQQQLGEQQRARGNTQSRRGTPEPRVVATDPRLEAEPDFTSPFILAGIPPAPGVDRTTQINTIRDGFRRDRENRIRIYDEQLRLQQELDRRPPRSRSASMSRHQSPPTDFDQGDNDGDPSFPVPKANAVIGTHPKLWPAPFAINKTRAREYVYLGYYLPRFCRQAAGDADNSVSNSYGLAKTAQGITFQPVNAAKAMKDVPKDTDLSWPETLLASRLYIQTLHDDQVKKWPTILIRQLGQFYMNLQSHPILVDYDDGSGERAVVHYQAEARRRWLAALRRESNEPIFDISIINDELLENFRKKLDNADYKAMMVRISLPSFQSHY